LKDDYIPQGQTIGKEPPPPPFPAYPQGIPYNGDIKNAENPKNMIQSYFDNKKE
jgi:hypothetical protein